MDEHKTAEQAYKKGYEKGFADAIWYAREELKKISQEIEQVYKTAKEMAGADNA